MPVQWSGLSPEVLLAVDRRAAEPLRSQVEGQLRQAIRAARLGGGAALPSPRELARELGLSRGLVQDCYAQLQAEGYLSTRVGSATRVSAGAASPAAKPAGAASSAANPAGSAGGTPEVAAGPAPARLAVDFASGVPDLASFPRADWAWAVREACRTAPNAALGYGDPRGSPQLRGILAAYLRRVRAAAVTAERIVICTGFAQGLNLVMAPLARAGVTRVGFEDPG